MLPIYPQPWQCMKENKHVYMFAGGGGLKLKM